MSQALCELIEAVVFDSLCRIGSRRFEVISKKRKGYAKKCSGPHNRP